MKKLLLTAAAAVIGAALAAAPAAAQTLEKIKQRGVIVVGSKADYKPFGFRELLARIRAVMRRARPGSDRSQIRVGELEIDVRGRRASLGDDSLSLTTKEFDLLALLASEPGNVVSRQRILREVWDTEWFGPTKTVDVHVASLRKKLGDAGWIETVRGVGLRLVPRP